MMMMIDCKTYGLKKGKSVGIKRERLIDITRCILEENIFLMKLNYRNEKDDGAHTHISALIAFIPITIISHSLSKCVEISFR
jgi:hypothetical protein